MKKKRLGLKILLGVGMTTLLAATAVIAYCGTVAAEATLDLGKLEPHARAVRVVDACDAPMGADSGYVTIDNMPKALIHAFVAVEDKRFYRHHGLDYRRIGGAILSNLRSHSFAEGASTITCQLVKNTHLTQEKTLKRKIKEAKLALELEKAYTKDEIMERYLNVIYLGSGIYGVGAAAERLYGKVPMALTTAECAAIAATTVNPSKYAPQLNAENNRARRDMVLKLMLSQGYLNEAEYEAAKQEMTVVITDKKDAAETYRISAIEEAVRVTGLDAKTLAQGYTVYTYCDMAKQTRASQTIAERFEDTDAQLIYADTQGRVLAYASDFSLPQGVVRRQIGSTIKPFVYAAAVEKNALLPDTQLDDSPTNFGDYAPHNYHDVYHGLISAREALAVSSNVAAVKVATYAGIEDVFTLCNRVGLPLSPEDNHLALALGGLTYGCTMDEMTTAYCTLAAGGVRHDAAFVRKVTDAEGRTVYVRRDRNERVMSAETAYLVSDMLRNTVTQGTAKRLGALGIALSAKTGTVEAAGGNSDAWCAAYNGDAVCIAWAGNLSMRAEEMTEATGGGVPCTAARDMMATASDVSIARPTGITEVEIDDITYRESGVMALASPNTPYRYRRKATVKRTSDLSASTRFEKATAPDYTLSVADGAVTLTLTPQPYYTYLLRYDNGFQVYDVDEIECGEIAESTDIVRQYDYAAGWWSVTPVLHGAVDVVGEPYRVMVT